MTITVGPSGYSLPTPSSSSPLTGPGHAGLHESTNAAVNELAGRVRDLEAQDPVTATNIEQARLVAHQWVVPGQLNGQVPTGEDLTHRLLLPLIWNLTGRITEFDAAKATVLVPADEDIVIDIVIGTALTGPEHDHGDPTTQPSILAEPLVIPAGEYFSETLGPNDFNGAHPVDSYIGAFIEAVGSDDAPGIDLNIQLNRLL